MAGILIHNWAGLNSQVQNHWAPFFLDGSCPCQTTMEQLLKADTSFGHERCFLVSRLTPKN